MATSTKFLHYSNPFFISIMSIIIVYLLIKLCTKSRSSISYPPSPLTLPIIGHLHLLSSSLPKSFQTLARRYGPLMRIHIGQSIFIVVSDAAVAKEFLKIHDAKFASRFEIGPAEYNIYKNAGFISSPYGSYWRFMRKLCMTKLFAGPQLARFNHIREEEITKLLKSLIKRSREGEWCDLSAELANLTNNLIFRMTMSKRFSKDGNEASEMWKLVVEIMGLAAKLGVNEVHGLLKKIDLFGNGKKLKEALERYDRLVEQIIRDYEETGVDFGGGNEDLMDILLGTFRDKNAELKITRDQIKYFILELFIASIDTSTAAIQWAMAELINHPEVFKKLREEIDSVVKSNRLVKESDVHNLPYLQAIAKETLRLRSPGPIFHRECTKDCKINGFDLRVKDRVLINAYAIMRHPGAWTDPDKYFPERFLDNSGENNKDQDFWYIPFGGGRRKCPGSLHAYLVMHMTVGALVQCFDWKIKDGEKVDISVGSGFSGAMALPMECYPILRFDPFQE